MSTVEADTREEVLDELRDATRFVLVTHENPDGDALGSLVAMHRILLALGKDSVMYMAADEFPLPYEYRFFELDGLQSTLPADLEERTIVFLDCGNIDRNPVGAFKREEAHILNIDHHHDNTRFGTVNHVVEDASCTAEIVWDLMRALGVEPAHGDRRGALRRARHRHRQVHVREHRRARARDGGRAHRRRASTSTASTAASTRACPTPSSSCWRARWPTSQRYDDGRLTFTRLTRDDFRCRAPRTATRRASSTTCARSRAPRSPRSHASCPTAAAGRARSRCAPPTAGVDVSVIARAGGGGGHRQAAGFATEMSEEDLVVFLREQVAAQL